METQSVVYIGPARPGVVIGDPYNRASLEAVYGVPVAVPAVVATGLLAQARMWATPERALELGVRAEAEPDTTTPDAPPAEPPAPPVIDPPADPPAEEGADVAPGRKRAGDRA